MITGKTFCFTFASMGYLQQIKNTATQLGIKLKNLDLNTIALSPVGKDYFEYNLRRIDFVNNNNAVMLASILDTLKTQPNNATIVDHGGGIGFFSFLCKSFGIGQVIYQDIESHYKKDTVLIANALGFTIDHYIIGDTDVLLEYTTKNNLTINGIGSRNVIEHVLDYRLLFQEFAKIKSSDLVIYIATSANIHNPVIHYLHKKMHHQYDLYGDEKTRRILNNATSGNAMRIEILKEEKAKDVEIQALLPYLRDKTKLEITSALNTYRSTKTLPARPDRTNTRDPNSGVWVERLVRFEDYARASKAACFEIKLLPGYYDTHYKSSWKNILAAGMNILVKIAGPWQINVGGYLAFTLRKKAV